MKRYFIVQEMEEGQTDGTKPTDRCATFCLDENEIAGDKNYVFGMILQQAMDILKKAS